MLLKIPNSNCQKLLKKKKLKMRKKHQVKTFLLITMTLKVLHLVQKKRMTKMTNLIPKRKYFAAVNVTIYAKKKKTLKNHMLTKHEHHLCKECHESLPNFMQLLKHVAKHHTKNPGED